MIPTIVTAKDFALTPSLTEYITEHAQRLVKHAPKLERVRCMLNVDRHHVKGETSTVEAWADVPGAEPFFATATGFDMRSTADEALEKLERQLEKYKDKLIDRHHKAE